MSSIFLVFHIVYFYSKNMNEIQDKRQVTAVFLGMGNKGCKKIAASGFLMGVYKS
jgi:hypothetical protein